MGSLGVAHGAGHQPLPHRGLTDRWLRLPHAFTRRPLLHLQRHCQRLQSRRWHGGLHAEGRQPRRRAVGLLARDADGSGWQKCQLVCPQRAGAGEVHLGCGARGQDDSAGVDRLGVPRHGHLARRPHRGRRCQKGADQDAQVGALDAGQQQVQLRPLGGQRGSHGHEQVHHDSDQERVRSDDPFEGPESPLGPRGLRRDLHHRAEPIQV
mmetsp:Transcript_56032/g.126292  ORF Transcript_56032/g.126292 Transcript_56032/m.126292 type:complete len:209 (-) Transcript_56032:732-1358(-)